MKLNNEKEIFNWGIVLDAPCNRYGCKGVIKLVLHKDCNCHNTWPDICHRCRLGCFYCPECDWYEEEENDGIVHYTEEEVETKLLDNIDF